MSSSSSLAEMKEMLESQQKELFNIRQELADLKKEKEQERQKQEEDKKQEIAFNKFNKVMMEY